MTKKPKQFKKGTKSSKRTKVAAQAEDETDTSRDSSGLRERLAGPVAIDL